MFFKALWRVGGGQCGKSFLRQLELRIGTVTVLPGMLDGPLETLSSPNKNHFQILNFKEKILDGH